LLLAVSQHATQQKNYIGFAHVFIKPTPATRPSGALSTAPRFVTNFYITANYFYYIYYIYNMSATPTEISLMTFNVYNFRHSCWDMQPETSESSKMFSDQIEYIREKDPDIFALQEAAFKGDGLSTSYVTQKQLEDEFPSHTFHYRPYMKKKLNVVLAIKKKFAQVKRPDIDMVPACAVFLKEFDVLIIGCHLNKEIDYAKQQFDKLYNESNVIVLGDFNHTKTTLDENTNNARLFKVNLSEKPTGLKRCRGNFFHEIDMIIWKGKNITDSTGEKQYVDNILLSDHLPVSKKLQLQITPPTPTEGYVNKKHLVAKLVNAEKYPDVFLTYVNRPNGERSGVMVSNNTLVKVKEVKPDEEEKIYISYLINTTEHMFTVKKSNIQILLKNDDHTQNTVFLYPSLEEFDTHNRDTGVHIPNETSVEIKTLIEDYYHAHVILSTRTGGYKKRRKSSRKSSKRKSKKSNNKRRKTRRNRRR
jgi:endonuclease/exonuclease/phosphatase family metal-dependent hydrolase